ncbi:MAG: cation-translocating P-type ATPase [Nitrospira sp.]|nr:cation-translocating P-type ATPase [Nitrospira sp.]
MRTRRLADGRAVAEAGLRLSGLHCAACGGLIDAALRAVPGVERVEVNAALEHAELRWRPEATDLECVLAALRAAGYDAALDDTPQVARLMQREQRAQLMRWLLATLCAMQVMMLAAPSYLPSGRDLAPDLQRLLNWGGWVLTLPVVLLSATPFFAGAWRSLRQRTLGMDVPVALGIAVTFVASSAATFHPGGWLGHEVYFDSLTMFVAIVLGARWLEMRARHRAVQQLDRAAREVELRALRLDEHGTPREVDARELAVGDRLLVPLGQAFAADGRIETGDTAVDESLLSGESRPLARRAGEAVQGGSLNVGAPVTVRVERVGDDSALQRIVELVRSAATQRPAWSRVADRWAAPFLWAVLLLAAGGAAVWGVIDPSRALWVAVAVLIVTCPCALSLAVPASLLAAAGALARRGVLLRRLDMLDALARVDEVFIDKTGTLTADALALRAVVALTPLPPGEAAALADRAATLARWSAHPLARALAAARAGAVDGWSAVREETGRGLSALDAHGRRWRLGSTAYVGVSDPAAADDDAPAALWFGAEPDASAAAAAATDGPCIRIEFDEVLRPDAAALVARWRADGVKLTLLSGDRRARAERIGCALRVDAVIAEATPQAKLDAVAAAQARGAVVAMVGDGINDAPVLARADVSLVMGQGAQLARARADAVLTGSRLDDLDFARRVALRARRVVRQNIAWAAGYNLVSVPLALSGTLPPWAAGLGMALSSLLVVGNAARLARMR